MLFIYLGKHFGAMCERHLSVPSVLHLVFYNIMAVLAHGAFRIQPLLTNFPKL